MRSCFFLSKRYWMGLVCLLPIMLSSDLSAAEPQVDPLDWTYCRGPHYDGTSHETGLIDDWDPEGGEGSNVLWKREDLGGRSTPIVMNGRLYTLVRAEPQTPREGEKVVCVDAATGETIWENRFNVYLSDVPDTRVGWSSVVGDPTTGRVYAQGVCGHFQCIDAETGETIWYVPLHERFGLLSTYGGRTNFPVIFEDLVIVSGIVIGWGERAKPRHGFIGFDKMSGEVVWYDGTTELPYDTTYSSPVLATLDGQSAMVFGSGDGGFWAVQPRTGKAIWEFPFSRRGINTAPLVANGTVYVGHSEENMVGTTMGAIAAIEGDAGGKVNVKWRVDEMMVGKVAPLMVGSNVWVFDDRAKLWVVNSETGEMVGKRVPLGTQMRANPLYADGKVYAFTANGRWAILEPDARNGAKILNRGRLPSGDGCNGSPIVSHGRIYVPTTGTLYCLYDADKEQGVTQAPSKPKEDPVSEDPQPAHLQIVPAEVLMQPGQSQQFTARVFNSKGQLLKEVNVPFTLEGPGTISGDGTFTAPAEGHVATMVNAELDGMQSQARVRIVPSLPWHFDFDDAKMNPETNVGAPPITWVGARYRHVIREIDGNKVMVKVSTIPKGTRSRSWMGHSDLSNYTIQADVRGQNVDGKLPDIGLIAQGYTLDLQGADQKLEIRTWVTQRRMARDVAFPWDETQWYTMKLRASIEGDQAVLKGKVWPRGEAEPDEWTVEAVDTAPNLMGSPGLFGNAKDAELYLDNIHVTFN